jgi:hypothetical protein
MVNEDYFYYIYFEEFGTCGIVQTHIHHPRRTVYITCSLAMFDISWSAIH